MKCCTSCMWCSMQATELYVGLFISLFYTFTSYCRLYPSHVAVVCESGFYSISTICLTGVYREMY